MFGTKVVSCILLNIMSISLNQSIKANTKCIYLGVRLLLNVLTGSTLLDISDVFVSISPCRVIMTFRVNALVCVAAEEVALCLNKVRRQVSPPVRVEVGERATQGGASDAGSDAKCHDASPCLRALV